MRKKNWNSLEIAQLKLHRAASEPNDDVKLVFLLSGIEALYESKEDRKAIPKIVKIYDKQLSEKTAKKIGQSYYRRNQIVHGKRSDNHHIAKLVPYLEKILRFLVKQEELN
jgi:hypothetical protein